MVVLAAAVLTITVACWLNAHTDIKKDADKSGKRKRFIITRRLI